MGPLAAALIPAGAQIIGGALGSLGQSSANAQNLKIAREQMRFQERMRNSEWQAAVKDMQLAGLNPALAYEKGGASSPAGSSATMQNAAAPLSAGVSSAAQNAAMFSQISLQQAEAKKTNAEAMFVEARAQAEIALMRANLRQTGMNTAKAVQDLRWNEETWGTRSKNLLYEARNRELDAEYAHDSMPARLASVGLEPKLRQADLSQRELELELRGLDRNEAEMWSKFYGSAGGSLTPWLNTAADIVKMFAPISKFFGPKRTTHVWKR